MDSRVFIGLRPSELRLPRVIIPQKIMTSRREYGLLLEYLNLKLKAYLILKHFVEPEITSEIN